MIVVAMPSEVQLVGNTDEPIIITGVGADNVIHALMGLDRNTPLHNVGYAGSNVLSIGSRVSVSAVKMYHPSVEYAERTYSLGGDIPCYTSSDFVTYTDIKEPCVFDMELAYILAMGFKNVTAEKIISDNLSLHDFERMVNTDGK